MTVGRRLRQLRRARGLTLDALAGDTGFTRGYLSQVETGTAAPSLTALGVLAACLGSDLADFFPEEEPPAAVRVVRAGDPERFRISPNSREEHELLTGLVPGGSLTANLARHYPGGPMVRFRHVGEEVALVLSGALRFDIDGDVRVVRAGEWIHYSSHPEHAVEVTGAEPADVLWLLSPGLL